MRNNKRVLFLNRRKMKLKTNKNYRKMKKKMSSRNKILMMKKKRAF